MLLCARVKECCDEYCDSPDPKNDRVVISQNLLQGKDMSLMLAMANNKGETPLKDVDDLKAELKREDVTKDITMDVNPGYRLEQVVAFASQLEAKKPAGPPDPANRFEETKALEAALVPAWREEAREAKALDVAHEEARQIEAAKEQAIKVQEAEEVEAALEAVEAQELLEAMEASLKYQESINTGQQLDNLDKARQMQKEEERADQAKLEKFLAANNFQDVNWKRTRYMKSSYPLHVAVSQNNAEMVQVLLAAGARPTLENSAKQTPLELAQKLNKRDSHAAVIKFLRFET